MSGIAKGIKKVFKKVVKVVKQIAKPLAIAVAAYFTAGVALSFIPATSAFAASLPGFASGGSIGFGIGAGKIAGTGIFSQAASTIGLGGNLISGGIKAGTGLGTMAMAHGSNATLAAVGSAVAPNAAAFAGAGAGAGAGLGAGLGAGAAKAGLSLTDQLLLAKVGTDLAGAAFGPTIEDEYEAKYSAKAQFHGSYYGAEAGGVPPAVGNPGAQSAPVAPQTVASQPGQPQQQSQPGGAGTDLFASTAPPKEERATNPMLYGEGQMQQQVNVPQGLFSPSPGVRYVG